MAAIQDQAIVLRRLDYSETSQVLAFFTREHGLRRLIAKGVKRGTKTRFATGIDLLERGWVVFLARAEGTEGLGTLTEWRQTEAYLGLREGLERLYAAQYAVQITAGMVEEADPHPELFDALAELLASLSAGESTCTDQHAEGLSPPEPGSVPPPGAAGAAVLPRLVGYQRALLSSVGLWPDLTRCVLCDKPAPPGRGAYFSAHQGGLICRDCHGQLPEKRQVSAAVLTALREPGCPPAVASAAFELLNYSIAHTLGRPPSLASFLLST